MRSSKKITFKDIFFENLGGLAKGVFKIFKNHQSVSETVEITSLELTLPRLDTAFEHYRLVQISDIHLGTWIDETRLLEIVTLVNQQSPDLIAITGDFITFDDPRYQDELVAYLSQLKPSEATLAVLGNHDHWTNPEAVHRILPECGIIDLTNTVHTVRRGDGMMHIAGVDDYLQDLDRLDLVLKQLPPDGSAILLAHEPDFADISAATGRFDLQLSGHTHGGQIRFPLIGPLYIPTGGKKYPLGRYQVNGMVQYTNRGIGTSAIQFRYQCPPEITVITLRAPKVKTARLEN